MSLLKALVKFIKDKGIMISVTFPINWTGYQNKQARRHDNGETENKDS